MWFLKCLQGGRAHPLAACGLATLCCSPPALQGTTHGYGLESLSKEDLGHPKRSTAMQMLRIERLRVSKLLKGY
jgi:hypothetical protein